MVLEHFILLQDIKKIENYFKNFSKNGKEFEQILFKKMYELIF